MKTFFTRFFVVLGVIFFILLCSAAYVWFADPFEIRPLVRMLTDSSNDSTASEGAARETSTEEGGSDAHPALTPAQEKALQTVGINPASLPTTLTKEQAACFAQILGAARVAEIQQGAVPSANEILSTRTCLK